MSNVKLISFISFILIIFCNGIIFAQTPDPPPPAFCAYAISHSTECVSSNDCTGGLKCTRDWNQKIQHIWAKGHCIDTNGVQSATNAVQADLCTLPNPFSYGGGTLYELPANSKLKIDDPDGDGKAISIYRKTIFSGNGALLSVPNTAPTLIALRAVVPLMKDEFSYLEYGRHASWSYIRDLAIAPDVVSNTTNKHTGLLIAAHGVRASNIQIFRMGRCFDIDGTGGKYNSNDFQIDNIVTYGCWGYGGYVHGGDSNGGTAKGMEMVGGVGLRDSSFLGNLWLGTQIEGNDKISNDPAEGTTPKKYSISAEGHYSTYIQTYIEASDADPVSNEWTNLIVGGNAVGRFAIGERIGGNYSRLIFRNKNTASAPYKLILGRESEPIFWQAYKLGGLSAEPYGHRLQWRPQFDAWQFESEAYTPSTGESGNRWTLRMRSSVTIGNAGAYSPGPKIVPVAETGTAMCHDTIDNDGDGKIDCDDTGCAASCP